MLTFENISFSYGNNEAGGAFGFEDLNFEIEAGEFVALAGPNGSGKSTLAMLAKGLLAPKSGRILFKGRDVTDEEINPNIGYLFSNPEDQIVSPVVENDVAFGPENRGRETSEINAAVDSALSLCQMTDLRYSLTHNLSGGGLQRLNIAGVLAMDAEFIIFDEAVSMLDAAGKAGLMEVLLRLNRERGISILHISHCMEDLMRANRVVVLDGGRVAFNGPPMAFIEEGALADRLNLSSSKVIALIRKLREEKIIGDEPVRDVESLADLILKSGAPSSKVSR